jgi:hypothetical protein
MHFCKTYQILHDVAYGTHGIAGNLRTSAQRALAAIDDINLDNPSDTMIDVVYFLLDGIFKGAGKDLETHLLMLADCELCDALRVRALGSAYANGLQKRPQLLPDNTMAGA